jgi:type VI secretion system protein ImpH
MAMAGADGPTDRSLTALLKHEPYRFELRQAVRLLELLAYRRAMHQPFMQPDRVPVGAGSDPRREAVRLRGSLRSSFPSGEIEAPGRFQDDDTDPANPGGQPDRPTLTATFFGISGGFGPLPPPLTTRVVERDRRRDHAARDFLDIFNHRLISLLLRQARLFNPALQIPPARQTPAGNVPAKLPLLSLLGVAIRPPGAVEARVGALATSLLGAAGLLNQRPASGHAVERLLGAHFGLPVRVLPLHGAWLPLADDQRIRLGRASYLGRDTVLGGRIWDQAAGICLEIGSLTLTMLLALLPNGSRHAELAGLVRFALGDAFDVELCLSLPASELPRGVPLGRAGPLLGWTSWLGQQARTQPGRMRVRLGTHQAEAS